MTRTSLSKQAADLHKQLSQLTLRRDALEVAQRRLALRHGMLSALCAALDWLRTARRCGRLPAGSLGALITRRQQTSQSDEELQLLQELECMRLPGHEPVATAAAAMASTLTVFWTAPAAPAEPTANQPAGDHSQPSSARSPAPSLSPPASAQQPQHAPPRRAISFSASSDCCDSGASGTSSRSSARSSSLPAGRRLAPGEEGVADVLPFISLLLMEPHPDGPHITLAGMRQRYTSKVKDLGVTLAQLESPFVAPQARAQLLESLRTIGDHWHMMTTLSMSGKGGLIHEFISTDCVTGERICTESVPQRYQWALEGMQLSDALLEQLAAAHALRARLAHRHHARRALLQGASLPERPAAEAAAEALQRGWDALEAEEHSAQRSLSAFHGLDSMLQKEMLLHVFIHCFIGSRISPEVQARLWVRVFPQVFDIVHLEALAAARLAGDEAASRPGRATRGAEG